MLLAMASTQISKSSAARIQRFVDSFIRSEYVANFTADRDSDFINEPERAARCYDAAEFGADGKTHAEVIQDWRDAFETYVKYDRRSVGLYPARFSDAVNAHFDAVEAWHEQNGSLDQEIG
jgi:hypothetical protein